EAFAGFDAKRMFDIGLLPLKEAKKWLVRKQYFDMAKTGRSYSDIKLELSVKYQLSVSSIEKLIYRTYEKERRTKKRT
ncbi:MAG: hypothetical protein ACK41O_25910, partial [Runella zeae]